MNTTVTIDKAGRIVVPKPIREALHLKPGDSLEIESDTDDFTLRPKAPAKAKARMEKGIWVFDTGGRITTEMVNDVLNQTRREREARASGK